MSETDRPFLAYAFICPAAGQRCTLYYSNSKYYSAATAEIETWHDYDWQGVAILADK